MRWLLIGIGVLVLLAAAMPVIFFVMERLVNPGVIEELEREPDGERARKVMLLTLPSGRRIPVNYLREGDRLYAAADGRWWRELDGAPRRVEALVRGERLVGRGRAVRDDPEHVRDVFSRLRPSALPGFGTLVEIELEAGSAKGSAASAAEAPDATGRPPVGAR